MASCCALACGSSSDAPPAPGDSQDDPLILIVVDTLRADMGSGARDLAQQPGFRRLWQEGVVFERAFAHAPMTLPAHASLFSARPPFASGVRTNFQSVPEDLPLLAEWLRSQGRRTEAVVSLGTLYPEPGDPGLARGFDVFDVAAWDMDPAQGVGRRVEARLDALAAAGPFFLFAHFCDPHHPYNAHLPSDAADPGEVQWRLDGRPMGRVTSADMTRLEETLALERGPHVLEFEGAVDFRLHRLGWTHAGQPLELRWQEGRLRGPGRRMRIAVEAPAAGESQLRFWISEVVRDPVRQRRRYTGEVAWVARHLARFLDRLEELELFERSLIVLTSDHGEALGERGRSGHIHDLYDELLHVPLVIKPPRGHPELASLHAASGELVAHQDVVPTLLELLGLPPLPGALGSSLLAPARRELIAQTHRPVARRDLLCLRDERFKLIHAPQTGGFEMYDLRLDPAEAKDVHAQRGAELEHWAARLRELARQDADQGATPRLSGEGRARLGALGYTEQDE